MSKKGQKYRTQKPPVPEKNPRQQVKGGAGAANGNLGAEDNKSVLKWLLLGGVLVITLICYSSTFKNQFSNWDDNLYLYDNPYVKSLSKENLKMMLTHSVTQNYFQPLTMLSLALNYHYAKMNPEPYYVTNVMIHLCNTALVFILALQLFSLMSAVGYGKIKSKLWLAALCALWQGIHPMHVESVSWLAERKDVLYLFFYLLGLVAYARYISKGSIKFLVYTTLFYFLSLMAKPLAVTFPLSVLCIDILLKRDEITGEVSPWLKPFYYFSKFFVDLLGKVIAPLKSRAEGISRILAEKMPLIIISAFGGIIAYSMTDKVGSIGSFQTFTIWQRIMFASYNCIMYFVKAIVPIHQSAFYPYPAQTNGWYPIMFYLAPFIALLAPLALLYITYRASENYFRVMLFGLLFYFFNVMFILQFISVGPTLMSERYSYAAYIGIIFMAVYFLYALVEKMPAYKTGVIVGSIVISSTLGYLCYSRTLVWHNSKVLWQDVIRQYKNIAIAYNNLGSYYQKHDQLDSALINFNESVRVNPSYPEACTNRSDIYRVQGKYALAIADCDSAIAHDKNYVEAYMNRGIAYCFVNKYDEALRDFSFVISHQSTNASVYCNRGNLYDMKGKIDSAFNDYNKAISLDDSYADAYFSRGRTYFKMNKFQEAVNDLSRAIELKTTSTSVYLYRSQSFKGLGNYSAALQDAQQANQLGVQVSPDYIKELQQLASNKK